MPDSWLKQSKKNITQKFNKAGASVSDLCCWYGFSCASRCQWRAKFGGIDASLMKRKPLALRCDDSTEFISHERMNWAIKEQITLLYSPPETTPNNAYIE